MLRADGQDIERTLLPEAKDLRAPFPKCKWGNPAGEGQKLPVREPPKRIGLPRHKNAVDKKDTRLAFGVALLKPVKWYLEATSWEVGISHQAPQKVKQKLAAGLPIRIFVFSSWCSRRILKRNKRCIARSKTNLRIRM